MAFCISSLQLAGRPRARHGATGMQLQTCHDRAIHGDTWFWSLGVMSLDDMVMAIHGQIHGDDIWRLNLLGK